MFFKAQAEGAVIELFKIGLNDTCTVDESGNTFSCHLHSVRCMKPALLCLRDIVDEFLDNAKYKVVPVLLLAGCGNRETGHWHSGCRYSPIFWKRSVEAL